MSDVYATINYVLVNLINEIWEVEGKAIITDEFKDIFMPTYTDDYLFEISELVIKYFNKQEYLTAFIIYGIV